MTTVVMVPQQQVPQQQVPQQAPQQVAQQYSSAQAVYQIPPGAPVRPPPLFHSKARVRKSFTADHPNEMSIAEGEIVEVITLSPSGWTLAASAAGQGWVPATYLEIIKDA